MISNFVFTFLALLNLEMYLRIPVASAYGKSCSIKMVSAPHGCLNLSIMHDVLKLNKIVLVGSSENVILYENNDLQYPKGLVVQHLMMKNAWYMLCGLDFSPSKYQLFVHYLNRKETEFKFCYSIYMDDSFYGKTTSYTPIIFPRRYFHENLYYDRNEKNTYISRDKYSHIYENLLLVKKITEKTEQSVSIEIKPNQKLKTYNLEFNDLDIIIGPSTIEYIRKKWVPFTYVIHLHWSDSILDQTVVTSFRMSEFFNIVLYVDDQNIFFNFGNYSHSYKIAIYTGPAYELFAGRDVKGIQQQLTDNVYKIIDKNYKYAVITFTIVTKHTHRQVPMYRYYVDLITGNVYSCDDCFVGGGFFGGGSLQPFTKTTSSYKLFGQQEYALFYCIILILSIFVFSSTVFGFFWMFKRRLINFGNKRMIARNGKRDMMLTISDFVR